MIKSRTIRVTTEDPAPPKNSLKKEMFYDTVLLRSIMEEIGQERIRYVTACGDIISHFYTIFYEADGLRTCPDCRRDYSPDHSFCGNCGKPLVPVTAPVLPACPHCGKPLSDGSAFCPFCGERRPEQKKRKGIFD